MIPTGLKAAVGAVVLAAAAGGQPADTPAQQFAKLKAEYEADNAAATEPEQDPKTGKVIPGHFVTKGVPPGKYIPRLMELGRAADEETAVAALSLAVRGWAGDKESAEPFDLLMARFAGSPRLADFVRDQQRVGYAGKEKRLERVVAEAKDPTALGLAVFQLARQSDPNSVRIADETPAREEARRAKAVELYRRVAAEFPGIEGGAVAARARRDLRALEKARAGRPAPPTAGPDLAGRPLDLADFKGKVVVVDFWGSWCGPCLRKLPMLKAAHAEYAPKGVAFLGVMAEAEKGAAAKAVWRHAVPWRNWVEYRDDNGDSPLATAWGVAAFPTLFVLDKQGTIRFTRADTRAELARALDELLAEPAPPAKR